MFAFAFAFSTLFVASTSAHSNNKADAIKYLRTYGYLRDHDGGDQSLVSDDVLRHAVSLYQEFYGIPVDGDLNEMTVRFMHKPRCGVPDLSAHSTVRLDQTWPKRHLTWNFKHADKSTLHAAEAAFDIWAAQSSLTFSRSTRNPDIVIGYRSGVHTLLDLRYANHTCSWVLDGPGGVLAHASYPNGRADFVSEIHIDDSELWFTSLAPNPPNMQHLLHTLVHEIGHSLGIQHSEREDSVMFSFPPLKQWPVTLSLDDVLAVQNLYGRKEVPSTTTTTLPTVATTPKNELSTPRPTTTTAPRRTPAIRDVCGLNDFDIVLVLNNGIYAAHRRYAWSIDFHGKVSDHPFLLLDYMRFLPANFTRVTAAYQRPSGDLVLFVDNLVYLVTYPSFALRSGWPRDFSDIGLPFDAVINAIVNTNTGRNYILYNDYAVALLDDCQMRVTEYNTLQAIFPGIPSGIKLAFRFTDGRLYFIHSKQFYAYNDYTGNIQAIGDFDARVLGVECPRVGILRQLQSLLTRLSGYSGLFSFD